MNFFESQDRVRRNTAKLVFLFVLAVVTLIIMTNLLVMMTLGYSNSEQLRDGETLLQQMDWRTFVMVSIGVGVVVLVGRPAGRQAVGSETEDGAKHRGDDDFGRHAAESIATMMG